MRINILQHTPNEGPGMILDWIAENKFEVFIYHPYYFGVFPTIEETDMLILLGGPISVHDPDEWIQKERGLIKEAIKKDIPIFGSCFGAQQVAYVMGGQVCKFNFKEVGWEPVYLEVPIVNTNVEQLTVLHWHEENFEIPLGAVLLFSGNHVRNQGFIYNRQIIGLQFHLEYTNENIREVIVNDYKYLEDSIFEQSSKDIIEYNVSDNNKKILFQLLDYISK